ncbi:hypothetical protein CDD83_6918 [Cordyceps sp. RAO-2017]|nr:hypothetical protein CDD83_6918 [Cordyceps sp. RAO-2017]
MTPTFASTLKVTDFNTLKVVTMEGEALPQPLADEWRDHVTLYNTYGPAETAISMTARRVRPNVKSYNIGWPMPTVETWVMRDNRPLLRGAVGELVIAGPQLSPGYWDNDEATKATFAWSQLLQRRIYHTGDMVRQVSDGSFEFVGRNDDLVKIRGMRVELSEIAAVCCVGHPSVVHAEVLLTSLPESAERSIVCFLDSGRPQHDSDSRPHLLANDLAKDISNAVAQHAASQLPQYMVPDLFVMLSSFPRTRSDKVDRRQLLDIMASDWVCLSTADTGLVVNGSPVDEEWNNQHRQLLDVIKEFAKIRTRALSPTTSLVELGLDSITAIKLNPWVPEHR